jgi:hypothetical protein
VRIAVIPVDNTTLLAWERTRSAWPGAALLAASAPMPAHFLIWDITQVPDC